MNDSTSSSELGRLVLQIKALVKEVGRSDVSENEIDSLAGQLLEVIGDVPPVNNQDDVLTDAYPEIETTAVTLWNLAVAKKNSGSFPPSLNAKLRHIAFKMICLCTANNNEEATLLKQIMMATKTGGAWLECCNPSMADNALSMAEEFVDRLQRVVEASGSACSAGGDADLENFNKKKATNQKQLFKIICYQAEAACGQNQNERAMRLMHQAKAMLPDCPSEGSYMTMLCFNFGVDEYQREEYEKSISWLRLSFEVGKTKNYASSKKQARTLRLLAITYLKWNSKEHWQKALNAIGLANAEHSHPAGLYLKVRILLEGEATDDRLQAAVDDMLRHSELTVERGITTLRLVSQYKRNDILFESLSQLAKRFDTSLDLGSIWCTHLELLINNNQMDTAAETAEDYITAHKTNKPMDVGSQKQFHLLFWDAAVQAFEDKDYAAALKWYNYSLSLFISVDEMDLNLAKLHRNRAFCYIALEQLDQAAAAVNLAEKCDDTSPHTHYFIYKIALLQGEDSKALEALKWMCSCEAGFPQATSADGLIGDRGPTLHGLISLAAHLAMKRGNRQVALTALEGLVHHPSCQEQMLTTLRCLVCLKFSMLDNPDSDRKSICAIIKDIELVYDTLVQLSQKRNPTNVNINDEATWFMKIAWNLALRCGDMLEQMHPLYILCYKLNQLFATDIAGMDRQKTCLLMATVALLQLYKDSSRSQAEARELLQKVVGYVKECNDIVKKIENARMAESGTASADTTTPMLLLLYEFEARAKLGDPGLDAILERAILLPKAEPKVFEIIAALAMEPPAQQRNISVRALKVAIKKHLQMPSVDYKRCSKAFHSLVVFALEKGSDKDEAWGYYMDAMTVIESAAQDQYPEMETLWLMTKAWNCGIHYYSGVNYEEARRWCEVALRLLKHLTTLQGNYAKPMNTVYSDILAKVDASKR